MGHKWINGYYTLNPPICHPQTHYTLFDCCSFIYWQTYWQQIFWNSNFYIALDYQSFNLYLDGHVITTFRGIRGVMRFWTIFSTALCDAV